MQDCLAKLKIEDHTIFDLLKLSTEMLRGEQDFA